MQELIKRAKVLLNEGKVTRVLGWKSGDLSYNPEPTFFARAEDLENFTYNPFCSANLSKYLIGTTSTTLVFLRPCDSYSFNQLVKEHRINRELLYVIGVGCRGTIDLNQVKASGIKGILEISGIDTDELTLQTLYGEKKIPYPEALLERCRTCKGKEHAVYDEIIGESEETVTFAADRFEDVVKIEKMTPAEKFDYFRKALSPCIRCNACRNVCAACSCLKCVFDSPKFDSEQKANVKTFEEKMFHIIRSIHVAGRCSDCGECSRVCPQGIGLHVFNRKLIKDINALYGDFQAGADAEELGPLVDFDLDDTCPNMVRKGGS